MSRKKERKEGRKKQKSEKEDANGNDEGPNAEEEKPTLRTQVVQSTDRRRRRK
jgi:hypothetical protein